MAWRAYFYDNLSDQVCLMKCSLPSSSCCLQGTSSTPRGRLSYGDELRTRAHQDEDSARNFKTAGSIINDGKSSSIARPPCISHEPFRHPTTHAWCSPPAALPAEARPSSGLGDWLKDRKRRSWPIADRQRAYQLAFGTHGHCLPRGAPGRYVTPRCC